LLGEAAYWGVVQEYTSTPRNLETCSRNYIRLPTRTRGGEGDGKKKRERKPIGLSAEDKRTARGQEVKLETSTWTKAKSAKRLGNKTPCEPVSSDPGGNKAESADHLPSSHPDRDGGIKKHQTVNAAGILKHSVERSSLGQTSRKGGGYPTSFVRESQKYGEGKKKKSPNHRPPEVERSVIKDLRSALSCGRSCFSVRNAKKRRPCGESQHGKDTEGKASLVNQGRGRTSTGNPSAVQNNALAGDGGLDLDDTYDLSSAKPRRPTDRGRETSDRNSTSQRRGGEAIGRRRTLSCGIVGASTLSPKAPA